MQHTVKDDYTHPELDWVGDGKLIFITAHRRENLGEPMHHMFRAIRRVLDEHPECKAVYPIHMNPVVRRLQKKNWVVATESISLSRLKCSIATTLRLVRTCALPILVEFRKNVRAMECRSS